MPKPLLLDGLVNTPAESDGLLQEWRREKQRLEEEILSLRHELDAARSHNEILERSLRALRSQLTPLHRALRAVFGEIELAVGEETFSVASAAATPQQASSADPRWASWKEKLPGKPAEMIDLLLLHKTMSVKALMTAMRCGKDAIYQAAYKLGQAGLLAGSKPYSLKVLD
jgi:hypothetical protein